MDAIHDNKLIVKLVETMKERNVKVPQLAKATGIPKDRIYKWFQEGNNPKAEDERKISAWINMEFPPIDGTENNNSAAINALREALGIIKDQNEYLRSLVNVSLTGLSMDVNNNAAAIRAEIRGYGKYQILKQSNWDDQEFAKAMAVVDKIYGEELKVDDGQGNART